MFCLHSGKTNQSLYKHWWPSRLRVDVIKLFGENLNTLFRKLDRFTVMQQILLMFIKWSSLQKSLSKFMPKYFYEIDPWTVKRHHQGCHNIQYNDTQHDGIQFTGLKCDTLHTKFGISYSQLQNGH